MNKKADQGDKIENPEIHLNVCGKTSCQTRENGLFNNWFESHMENDKIVLFPHTIHLDKVQMTQRFKCKKNETI